MLPVLFSAGPLVVHTFAVMMAIGFLAGFLVLRRELEHHGYEGEAAQDLVIVTGLSGIAGARLYLLPRHWHDFLADPVAFLFGGYGFAWYGGVFGGAVGAALLLHRVRIPWRIAFDALAKAAAIGLACGRLGCHLAGDGDWGTVTDLPWAVAYTNGTVPWPHPDGVRVHPAPLYELGAMLAIFALLHARRIAARPGMGVAVYLLTASACRFAIEGVRVNSPWLLGLTEAQWIAAVLATVGGALISLETLRRARTSAPLASAASP